MPRSVSVPLLLLYSFQVSTQSTDSRSFDLLLTTADFHYPRSYASSGTSYGPVSVCHKSAFYRSSWNGSRSEGHRAALTRGGKRAKIVFKNSRANSDCIISYVFACNKNKALQLQRVHILSILGYNTDLYFKRALQFPKPKTKGRQI